MGWAVHVLLAAKSRKEVMQLFAEEDLRFRAEAAARSDVSASEDMEVPIKRGSLFIPFQKKKKNREIFVHI